MRLLQRYILSLLLLVPVVASGLSPDTLLLQKHVRTLSAPAMEGRETGTSGEKLAYEYISGEFLSLGLKAPYGSGYQGYIQPFTFNAGSYAGPANVLKINHKALASETGFYPLAWSANGSFKGKTVFVKHGIAAPGRDDYQDLKDLKGKVFVMEFGYPADIDPHSRLASYADIRTRIDSAAARGAVAIIFINSDTKTDNPPSKISNRITPSGIPVLFAHADKRDRHACAHAHGRQNATFRGAVQFGHHQGG